MGFLERSRSLRRKEAPFARKKQEDTPSSQPTVEEKGTRQRPIQSAHSHREGPQPSKDLPRPRTAGRAPARNLYSELPPPPSMENLADKPTFKLPNLPPRMSMTPSPRSLTPSMTFLNNHSTTGVNLDRPRHPKRSFTSPCEVPRVTSKKDEKASNATAPSASEIASNPPRKEPHLRKAKSGTWRSLFSRKMSKPPVPDFNPAEFAPAPALPKSTTKEDSPMKDILSVKVSPMERMPALAAKDVLKASERNSISVEKTRTVQQVKSRALMTKSMIDPSMLPKLRLETPNTLEPPPRISSRSPSAESGMTQFFDAASHASFSPAPSPLQKPVQPRLDIDIPDIGMERYSIMFEKLLKPQPALYERRQTMVKQLQLGEESSRMLTPESPQLQRRATSPNLTSHTPLTAEMVGDDSQVATPVPIYRVSQAPRLLRSQTAPPGSLTQSQTGFEKPEAAPSTAANSSACSASSPVWSEASLPQTPASDTETFVSFDLNTEDDDDDGDYDVEIVTCNAISFKSPMYNEPKWKTSALTSAPPIPPKAPGRNSPPAKGPTIDRPHPPRTSSLDDVAAKRRTRSGPQIGVARQVSVVQRPSPGGLGVPSMVAAPSPVRADPVAPISVFSKQPLRPRLVDVRNRKSTLVVLDED